MILTDIQLIYLLACYSIIFSLFGLFFFVKAVNMYNKNQKLIEDFLDIFDFVDKNNIKNEGTVAD